MTNRKDDLYSLPLDQAVWRKSPFSDGGNQCVEIADLPGGGVALRDSKHLDREPLRFTADEWDAFQEGVRSGAL